MPIRERATYLLHLEPVGFPNLYISRRAAGAMVAGVLLGLGLLNKELR